MFKTKEFRWSLVLFLIPLIVDLILYPQLPNVVATHFDENGNPNSYMQKGIAILVLFVFMLVTHILVLFFTSKDPKGRDIKLSFFRILCMICPILYVIVNGIIMGYALGYEIHIVNTVSFLIGLVLIVMGLFLPKSNLPLNLPWDIKNEELIHQLYGYCLMAAGLLFMVCGFINQITIGIIGMLILLFMPILYSYYLYKNEK